MVSGRLLILCCLILHLSLLVGCNGSDDSDSDDNYTLSLGLEKLQQLDRTNWPLLMAASVVMTVPVLIVFLLAQRYLWCLGQSDESTTV